MEKKDYVIPMIEIIEIKEDEIISTSAPVSTKEDPYREDIY